MKKNRYRPPNTKKKKGNFNTHLALALIATMIILLFVTGCAQTPQIQKINIEVPCQVSKIPLPPSEINLEEATINTKMLYIKMVVKYAKEVAPIMRKCVVEKRIEVGKTNK